jgi:hypothetical protein
MNDAETYLCETALVQNALLELRDSAEVSSQRIATGRSGEGGVTKGPGKGTLGDGISAWLVRQSPPF